MKKKKGYSYLDYYGLSQYRDVVEEAKEKLREQIRLLKIEESRRLLGGKEGIHLKDNDEQV
jgi:hypothetical protein